ncbi:beta-lactamase [Enhydrobacter aerosaccus SK60]|nr:beta-lactamase [Enhydrobacter aerosaccus SK60]
MFRSLKKTDILQLCFIILFTILAAYFYVNNDVRNQTWQKIYPIRAQFANNQLSCSPNSPAWLADIIKDQTINGNAPANQIAYLDPKGNLYHCENGYVGEYPILSQPVSANTRFRYASVTKLWTSDSIFELIKQNKLSLDTPLVKVLTQIKNPKDPRINQITIGDLLLHRGGFDRYTVVNGQDMFGIGKDICPNHIDLMNSLTLNFEPNTKMSYSNLGYCLLGEAASQINNKPYTQLLQDNYRLDTTTLRFIGNQSLGDEVNYNYVETGLTGIADIYTAFDYKGLASVAGMSGNAIDLAKQVKQMANKPEPNILSLNTKLTCDITKLRDCYGYAMFPYQRSSQDNVMYFRDGALLGLSSLVAVDKKFGVVALLSNGSQSERHNDQTKMQLYNIANAK